MFYKHKLLIFVISIQLIIVFLLLFQIVYKQNNILGAVNINPINKNEIIINKYQNFKYFYEPKANIKKKDNAKWLNGTSIQTINNDSLNERFNYSIDKSKNVFRIITLGDSFTYGEHVSTIDNWTEKLEDKLNNNIHCKDINKFEVINLGVPGYDIQYEAQRFQIRGQKYNPDLILWFLKDDDFEEITEETQPIKNSYINNLKKENLYDKYYDDGNIVKLKEGYRKGIETINKKYTQKEILEYQKSMIKQLIKEYKNKLFIFSFGKRVSHTGLSKENINRILDAIKNDKNALFSNNLFLAYNDSIDSFTPYDYHPNQKGHRVIAEDLYNYLTKNKIIPCD